MKTTKEMIEVMKAYEEGKVIEVRSNKMGNNEWSVATAPQWEWWHKDYRVKEEPKYRPYKDTEEMINDFCERSGAKRSKMGEPFIWVKVEISELLITHYGDDYIFLRTARYDMQELFDNFTFCDGSPIGKKE